MRRLLGIAVLATLMGALPAWAGASLSVAPVTLEFRPGARALATEVSNLGDAEMTVQVRLFRWSTAEDGDHYEPSQDIGFSPPIFKLAPGARQTLRMALIAGPSADRETAYRLFVDQLPDSEAVGVQLPVRLVLPVFVPPVAVGKRRPSPPALDWSARRGAAGEVVLVAANHGQTRAKLLELMSHEPDGAATPIRSGLAGYVLAGETRGWTFTPERPTSQLDISARGEDGDFRITVPVSP